MNVHFLMLCSDIGIHHLVSFYGRGTEYMRYFPVVLCRIHSFDLRAPTVIFNNQSKQAAVTLLSHLGSEEVRFTQLPASSSGDQVTRTATLVSIRDNVRDVIGQQSITTDKDATDDQQYRAISSAYVRQLKHLMVKRIPRDSLATIRTVKDFRSFAAR